MGIDTSGFDDLADKLDEMQESVKEIDGSHQVPLTELFPSKFMRRHTDAHDVDQFLENSPWNIESQADFEDIPEIELDQYVDQHSEFRTWEQMQSKAAQEWMERQLNF